MRFIVPLALLLLTRPAPGAPSIGLNFEGDDFDQTGPNLLAPSDVAGVIAASNWNNAVGTSGVMANLNDSAGETTTVIIPTARRQRSGVPLLLKTIRWCVSLFGYASWRGSFLRLFSY